jgi:hypothetical protein
VKPLERNAHRIQRQIAKGIAWGGVPSDPKDFANMRRRWIEAQKVIDAA